MARYRKKPVVIEAFQMTAPNDYSEWPEWLKDAWSRKLGETNGMWVNPNTKELMCGTLEGPHVISPDDFVIQGVAGEIYPCKPDIFEATYEKV